MKRFCTVLFSAAVLLAAVLSASCSDGGFGSQGGDTAQVPGDGTATGGAGEEGSSSGSGWEYITVPSAPENVTATASGSSSITVSWDAVDGADRYIVYYRSYSGTNDTYKRNGTEKTKSTENTSVLIQQLEHKYYLFWVTAENSAGESEESMWAYAMPNSSSGSGGSSTTTTLSAPTGLYATAASSSSVRLTWNSVSGATKYYVYKSQYASFATSDSYSTTSTFMTVTGLKANTKYYFRVQAANSTTTSGYSASDYATTEAVASWNPPTRYQELANLGADNAIIGNVSAGNVYWFRLYASQPSSSTYTYTISFLDKDASSSYSSDVVATYYNQNGTVYASGVDNGLFGRSCSYPLSQYLYVKVECKKSGSFAIYAERKK